MLQKCEGFDSKKMKTVVAVQPASKGPLSFEQWALLRYADVMSRNITVDRAIFSDLQNSGLSDREIVELTVAIGPYSGVSGFLVALDGAKRTYRASRTLYFLPLKLRISIYRIKCAYSIPLLRSLFGS